MKKLKTPPVSFYESFQEWAEKYGILPGDCTCKEKRFVQSPEQHHPECPWSEAWEVWTRLNRKLYQLLKGEAPKRAGQNAEAERGAASDT